jgi:hypothetical protein
MLAGLLRALQEGLSFDHALRSATGLAAAQAESLYVGQLDPARARRLVRALGPSG